MSTNSNIFYKLRAIDSISESFAKQFSDREVKFFAQYGVNLVSIEITMTPSLRMQILNRIEAFHKGCKSPVSWGFSALTGKID